jgi:hypothetical protein
MHGSTQNIHVMQRFLVRQRTERFCAEVESDCRDCSDIINVEHRTEITGWRFAAVVVVVGDRVVHKAWSGVPAIREVEESLNPLGPLQDRATSMVPLPVLY